MLFNSLPFLIFFPLVTLVYFLIPHRVRWVWLLAASYYFYMSWNASYALLIAFSTLVTYLSGLLIGKADALEDQVKAARLKKLWVALSFAINLAILVFFKYFGFLLENLNAVLSAVHLQAVNNPFDFVLPVGISFYTFQALSYTMDVYRGDIAPERNLGKYALFVSFFPQLVAGPIERSGNLLTQIHERHTFDYRRMVSGLLLMGWGFFQKMVVADRFSIFVDAVFNNYTEVSGGLLLLAVFAFAVQIYCDFAGYSNIAIGAAEVMGFDLMQNFKQPYFACSIKEFWRRWHISLSTWFRDYVYIPLGGNRKGRLRKNVNLMITFLLSGIWHGASWNYVIWGGIHGLYQVIGDLTQSLRDLLKRALRVNTEAESYRWFQQIITFALVCFAWIFFRAKSMEQALTVIKKIVTEPGLSKTVNALISGTGLGLDRPDLVVAVVSLAMLLLGDLMQSRFCVRAKLMEQNLVFRWAVYILIIVLIMLFGVYGTGYDATQFIYFQF